VNLRSRGFSAISCFDCFIGFFYLVSLCRLEILDFFLKFFVFGGKDFCSRNRCGFRSVVTTQPMPLGTLNEE
jgi:hypothetical protein